MILFIVANWLISPKDNKSDAKGSLNFASLFVIFAEYETV